MEGAELEQAGIGRRKRREEVGGDEERQPLPGREQQRRRLYLEAAQLQSTRPRSPVAPCLHCELHLSHVNGGFTHGLRAKEGEESSHPVWFSIVPLNRLGPIGSFVGK